MKRRLVWQYLFCVLFSVIYAIFFGLSLKNSLWLVLGIGFLNSIGVYAQWQSIKISLSKTYLFTQADDFIAVMLGYLLINEMQFLNYKLAVGVVMCFISGALIMTKESNYRLIKLVAVYSVVWGLAAFLFRWFALQKITFSEFLIGWYVGSLLGVLGILIFAKTEEMTIKLAFREIYPIGVLAIAIWISLLLGYWCAYLAPITVYQPIFLASEAILPPIIGLTVFKEAKTLIFREKLAFAVGLIGVIAILLGY